MIAKQIIKMSNFLDFYYLYIHNFLFLILNPNKKKDKKKNIYAAIQLV